MKARTFTNVWDALEDSPEEAAVMTMRSNVMSTITDTVRSWNTTQARAARRLGRPLPVRVEDVVPIAGPLPDHLRPLATADVAVAHRVHQFHAERGI